MYGFRAYSKRRYFISVLPRFGNPAGDRSGTSAAEEKFGNMVALQGREIILVPLKSLAGIVRQVPLDSQLIRTAESIGVCLGG